jgi:hypothetical protein
MPLQIEPRQLTAEHTPSIHSENPRSRIRKEIGKRIYDLLQTAKDLPTSECLNEVRTTLLEIQQDCQKLEKSFIFVEKRITCANYALGGSATDQATLFRGPREDASVAICVTDQGSVLHRNGSPWTAYRNVGDVLKS